MAVKKRCRHPKRQWSKCPCRWYLDWYLDGRRLYTGLEAKTRPEALVEAARLKLGRLEGQLPRARRGHGVCEVADRWLLAVSTKPDARQNSIHVYRSRINHLKAWFGERPIEAVTVRDVREFVEAQTAAGRAPATVRGIYAALRAVFNQAQTEGLIETLPFPARTPAPSANHRGGWPTLNETERVIAHLPADWHQIAELLLLTGLRISEVLALRADDLDRGGPVLHVRRTQHRFGGENDPKTRSGKRAVPLTPRALALLDAAPRGEQAQLWPDARYKDGSETLRAVLRSLDLYRPGIGWHLFRNANAALLNEAKVSLRDAAARLGHGPNFVQTHAYGWAAETGDASVVDLARAIHRPSEPGAPASA